MFRSIFALTCLIICLFGRTLNANPLVVELCNAEYSDGVLTTNAGGVIAGLGIKMQAQRLSYTARPCEGKVTSQATAEGDVRVEYGGFIFIGKKLTYDFIDRTGFLYGGRTGHFPWYCGGQVIQLCCDGSYIIHRGFLTTSEGLAREWSLDIDTLHLYDNKDFHASKVSLKLFDYPLFWVPALYGNLDTLSKIPIKCSMRLGGRQGSRIGLSYTFIAREYFHALLRLDYNFKRGIGGGVEGHYYRRENNERFDSINYFAKDIPLSDPSLSTRYRLQGHYMRCWRASRTLVDLVYDKLSDQDMATDYLDRGLDIDIALRSRLLIHHEEPNWIGNLTICPRLNTFQTIKQEFPTLTFSLHPVSTPLAIMGMTCQASYLDFSYAHGLSHVKDFTAIRTAIQPYGYLPIRIGALKLVPRVDYVGIFYGNTPHRQSSWLSTALLRCDGDCTLHKSFSAVNHILSPYFSYLYITSPTVPPSEHYIFDIEDGWYRAHSLRAGVQQSFQPSYGSVIPWVKADLYGYCFFDKERGRPIPRAVLECSFYVCKRLHNRLEVAYDLAHGGFLFLNFRSAWTISDHAAISLEYRQRSAYDWRKVDKENFILDFYRSEGALLHSPLSDRRRTLLLHFYCYLTHKLALEWKSRLGWERRKEPGYLEFDVNIHTALPASWRMRFGYQHKEADDRVAIKFSLG